MARGKKKQREFQLTIRVMELEFPIMAPGDMLLAALLEEFFELAKVQTGKFHGRWYLYDRQTNLQCNPEATISQTCGSRKNTVLYLVQPQMAG